MRLTRKWEQDREDRLLDKGTCFVKLGGGGGGKAPKPDPLIGQAAMENAAISREMADLARKEYEDNKVRYEKYEPIYQQQLEADAATAKANAQRSDEQWEQYKTDYQPIERKLAQDSLDWDSAANLDKASQDAEAIAARNIAAQDQATTRGLSAFGVNPNSGRFVGTKVGLNMAGAATRANASNTAMENRRSQAIQLRTGAAQFGRNMPQTGIAASGLGLQASQQTTNQANNAALMPGQLNSQVLPWYTGAASANQSAGNLLLGQYQGQLGAWQAKQQASAQSSAGMGQLAGTAIMAGAMMMSSEEVKEDKEPVSGKSALEGLEAIPVESWKYKAGAGDGGRHIGPYAEDVNAQFGDKAAPGGVGLDMVTMNGITIAAIKELNEKVKKLSAGRKGVVGLDSVIGNRDTEPTSKRRVA